MVMYEKNEDLELLRQQVRNITAEIMRNVQKRMELAKQIGDLKSRLGIDVKDEKVEEEIRSMVTELADQIGMSNDFALRLLNILLAESALIQGQKQPPKTQKQTHLGIFMRAKMLEMSGKKIIHMEVGEPDYPPPAIVGSALVQSFQLKQYHYTDTRGIPKLRDALAKKAGVPEDHIIVTPGGRFAVFSAIASLLKAGQELIVIEPSWPAYKECADFIGAKTKILKTSLESRWTPDAKRLEKMITPSTKIIVINYPNNPTGKVLDNENLEKIVSIAKDYGIYLLSDEVYADYSFKKFTSISEYNYDKGILVGSFSKRYAMTGFRVGYGVASKDIISKMAKVQAIGITSVAEPMQQAALVALCEDPSENVKIMKKRLDRVSSRLKQMSLRFVEPDGSMYIYPELPNGEDIALVEKMLDKGVAIAPGSGFGNSYQKFVRISACQTEEILDRGLDVMESVMREEV
jgi:aspartate aminotransferase